MNGHQNQMDGHNNKMNGHQYQQQIGEIGTDFHKWSWNQINGHQNQK